MTLPLQRSLFLLASLWFVGLLIGIALIFAASVEGLFGTSYAEAWKWLLPNTLPTLAALFTAIGAGERAGRPNKQVGRSLFSFAVTFSIFYLVVLLGTLLVTYVQLPTDVSALQWLLGSNAYLGPLQGFAASLVAYLCVRGY